MDFKIVSEYQPTGDQPEAIRQLTEGLRNGTTFQTLLGVTGSGENIYHGQRDRTGETSGTAIKPQ